LSLHNFKIIEALGLKINTSRSPWMALPPHQISWKYNKRFNRCWGNAQTDTQADNLMSLLSFLESRLRRQDTELRFYKVKGIPAL
jgi:hypothetical protein